MGEFDCGEEEILGSQASGSLEKCILAAKERAAVLHKLFE